MLYFISSTLNTVLFVQAPPKPYQNHHLDFRSHKFLNGRIRIRTFKTQIRIGEKNRIHPDPNTANVVRKAKAAYKAKNTGTF